MQIVTENLYKEEITRLIEMLKMINMNNSGQITFEKL